jgi:hypothetical protein
MNNRWLAMAAVAGLCSGCWAGMQERLDNDLRRRATFDLSCPLEGIRMVPLSQLPTNRALVGTYGVYACGRQATYVLEPHTATWVLNSRTEAVPAAAWPAAAQQPAPAAPPALVATSPHTPAPTAGVTVQPVAPAPTPAAATPPATVVMFGPPEPAATEPQAVPAGLPESPSRTDVQGALEPLREAVRACAGGASTTVQCDLEFRGATGRVNKITITTGLGTDVAACIGEALLGVVVPPFSLETLVVRYPWSL